MSLGALAPMFRFHALRDGQRVPGAKLHTFLSGTSTPAAVYFDKALTTPHPNPVQADVSGVFPAMYTAPVAYRVAMTDGEGVAIIPPTDNVYDFAQVQIAAAGNTTGAALIGFLNTGDGVQPTTVQAKLREWLSLKADFGAAGNGVTDDTAATQNWLNAGIATGRPLWVEPGVYALMSTVTATITNDNTLTIHGAGRGNLAGGSSRFILGRDLASSDTPLMHINGNNQSTLLELDGLEFRGERRIGTALKTTDLYGRITVRRSWFQNFRGRGLWLYAPIGVLLDSVHCEGNATNLEIGGTSSIGEGAIVGCKFASATTRNVHLNTGATFLSFIGCTIYGAAAPDETIGVELADGVFCVGFYQTSFENCVPALFSAGNVTELVVEGCVINPRNLTGAGTRYGIDLANTANCRIQGNAVSGGCAAGGALVGIQVRTSSSVDTFGPNRFEFTGAGTTTNYRLPDGAAGIYGVGRAGNAVALAQIRQSRNHTRFTGDEYEVPDQGVLVTDAFGGGLLVVRASDYAASFAISGGRSPAIGIIADLSARFSTARGTAAKCNVFFDAGVLTIENRLGTAARIMPILVGG